MTVKYMLEPMLTKLNFLAQACELIAFTYIPRDMLD